jgi:hypothetical protein
MGSVLGAHKLLLGIKPLLFQGPHRTTVPRVLLLTKNLEAVAVPQKRLYNPPFKPFCAASLRFALAESGWRMGRNPMRQ